MEFSFMAGCDSFHIVLGDKTISLLVIDWINFHERLCSIDS